MSDGFAAGKPVASDGFVAGFSARHDLAAQALQRAFAMPQDGFAAIDPRDRIERSGPVSFSPQPGPKHFSPADRTSNPTAGWDPLDPTPVETPRIDPLIEARAAGYSEGLAAAQAALTEAGNRDRALLEGLLAQIAAGRTIDRARVAEQLRQTVLLLVSKIVGETGVSADLLAGRVATAGDLIADAAESALLRVHPDDVALLESRLPGTVFAVGDATVARGSFVLESASTIVEDGPALWLDQLAQAVDRVALPPAC